jgi:N12 class adenine-specific DNA methylase
VVIDHIEQDPETQTVSAIDERSKIVGCAVQPGWRKQIYTVVSPTEAAREKQQRIKESFKEWVWAEDSRRERLCRLYNDTFNHTRLRTFNGEHLTLPGASKAIQLHSHQKAGVWRILQTPNTLLAHVVGGGKTFTLTAAAMELKRLGLARKPLFAVPNHMLGQFSTELLTLYPGANILVAGKDDFEAKNRKKLFSRIATGNWDAVIVTHSGFERIPLNYDTKKRFFEEQLHELEMVKRQHADTSNRRLVKELERAKKRLEARLRHSSPEKVFLCELWNFTFDLCERDGSVRALRKLNDCIGDAVCLFL